MDIAVGADMGWKGPGVCHPSNYSQSATDASLIWWADRASESLKALFGFSDNMEAEAFTENVDSVFNTEASAEKSVNVQGVEGDNFDKLLQSSYIV